MSKIDLLREDPRILVVAGPAHGDILLATPLLAALRGAWPAATLDALVYTGQQGILEGNADLDEVIAVPKHPRPREYWGLLTRILRQYDLAISTKQTDRVIWYVFLAGRRRIAAVPAGRDRWKRWVTHDHVPHDGEGTHTLLQNGKLAALLGIPFRPRICLPRREQGSPPLAEEPAYAVVHVTPGLPYKRWHVAGWQAVGAFLQEQGLRVVLTGGGSSDELAYVEEIAGRFPAPAVNLAGKLSFAELTTVLERSTVYVGADTVATHMAAATGVPTVSLYGPESPVVWGPWPAGLETGESPWRGAASDTALQQRGNVTVLQSAVPCATCRQGACLRRSQRQDPCTLMTTLETEQVLAALAALPVLAGRAAALSPPGAGGSANRPLPSS